MSKKLKIYLNPHCNTCKEVMGVLEDAHCELEIVEYLKNFPSKQELEDLVKMLGLKPHDLIRTKEPVYQKKFAGKELSDEEWLQVIIDNPILLQRPIIVGGNKAMIGRPIERVVELVTR